MKEMETLLPAAEKFAREGFGNRESWAKATLDFPKLQLARFGVDLLLGCLATIGNVERLLKRVAHRGDVSTGVEMNDIFLCDAHAPKPHEVADAPSSHALVEHKAIVPKTPYLSKILGTYETIFGGRRWKEQPNKYRNRGVQKDPDALQKLRRDKGLPQTETDFLRTREAEIHNALEESVEQRAKKIAKGKWGGPVPKDTGKHVTPAIEKIRRSAAERQKKKNAQVLSSSGGLPAGPSSAKRKKLLANAPRWASVCRTPSGTSQTPAAIPHNAVTILVDQSDNDLNDVLIRRHFHVINGWTSFARKLLSVSQRHRVAIVVAPSMHEGTLANCVSTLVCRVVGGHLTCHTWLKAALRDNEEPKGLQFQGILSRTISLHFTRAFEKHFVSVSKVFDKLGASKGCRIHVEKDMAKLLRLYKNYFDSKGPRSRPWSKYCIITKDEAEAVALRDANPSMPKRAVQSFNLFLDEQSMCQRTVCCPGRWVF